MPSRIPYSTDDEASGPDARQIADQAERQRFYQSKRWKRLRARKLVRNPLCEPCEAQGRITAASDVHHIIDRLERPDLAYDFANLEATCKSCHRTEHNKRKGKMGK